MSQSAYRYVASLLLLAAAFLLLSSFSNNWPQIDTALNYLYVREIKPNRSPEIDMFNRSVGNPLGASYCGAFVGYDLTASGAIEPEVRSGLARNYYRHGFEAYSAGSVIRGINKVEKGDIIIWARGNAVYGHTGFAFQDWDGPSGKTIEANTSPPGGSQWNGDGVYIKEREIHPYSFFRIIGFSKVRFS